MPFVLKPTKQKTKSSYKTIYLSQDLIDAVNKISKENNTSFNNVITSMIEYCLEENNQEKQENSRE